MKPYYPGMEFELPEKDNYTPEENDNPKDKKSQEGDGNASNKGR